MFMSIPEKERYVKLIIIIQSCCTMLQEPVDAWWRLSNEPTFHVALESGFYFTIEYKPDSNKKFDQKHNTSIGKQNGCYYLSCYCYSVVCMYVSMNL